MSADNYTIARAPAGDRVLIVNARTAGLILDALKAFHSLNKYDNNLVMALHQDLEKNYE